MARPRPRRQPGGIFPPMERFGSAFQRPQSIFDPYPSAGGYGLDELRATLPDDPQIGLPDLEPFRWRLPEPRAPKVPGDYVTGGFKEMGLGRRGTIAEAAAGPLPTRGVATTQPAVEGAGLTAAVTEAVTRQTEAPFAATIVSPFAHQQYLIQEASRLRRRRNLAREEELTGLRTEARREAFTERRERGGRPSNVLTETAAGLPLAERNPPGMRFAPEPTTAQQQQGDWVAERRFGEQAARNIYGADINAPEVWSGIARKQAAGQSLTDLEIDAVAWVRAQTRSRQRGGR